MRVGGEVMVEPHRHEGAFIAKGEEDVVLYILFMYLFY
jgi:hypothetical protein